MDVLFFACESLLFALRSHSPAFIRCKAYIYVAMAFIVCGELELSQSYLQKSEEFFKQYENQLDPLAHLIYHVTVYVPYLFTGQYQLALNSVENVKLISEKMGNKRRLIMALSGLSLPRFFFNPNFESCISLSNQSYSIADRKEVSDIQYRISSRLISALVSFVTGEETLSMKLIQVKKRKQ